MNFFSVKLRPLKRGAVVDNILTAFFFWANNQINFSEPALQPNKTFRQKAGHCPAKNTKFCTTNEIIIFHAPYFANKERMSLQILQ